MDFSAGPFPHGLIIIQGNNEAGKSTVLSFVNAMFFGFPDARRRERQFHPLRGGRYGGRITIATEKYGEITIERIKTSSTILRLYDSRGRQLDSSKLKGIFGGVSRQLYHNVFSFGLQELWNFEMLSGDDIKSAIYGAGFGTAFLAVSQVEKGLKKERDAIFRPSGRKQPLNQVMARIKALNAQIKKSRQGLDRYQALVHAREELEAGLLKLRENRREAARILDLKRAARDMWQDWENLSSVQAELSVTNQDKRLEGISEDLFWELEGLEKLLFEKRTSLKDVASRREEAARLMKASVPDAFLIGKKEEISALPPAREKYFQLQEFRNSRRRQIHQLEEELTILQGRLGSTWSQELIRQTVFSAADRSIAARFRQRLGAAEEKRRRLSELLAIREKDMKAHLRELEDLEGQINSKIKELPHEDLYLVIAANSKRLYSAAEKLQEKSQELGILSEKIDSGMAEVFDKPDSRVLEGLDPSALIKETEALKKRAEEGKRAAQELENTLETLRKRRNELEKKITRRQALLREMTLPRCLQGIGEESIRDAFILARTLSGYVPTETNSRIELSKTQEDMTRCSSEAARLQRKKEDLERSLLPGITAASGLVFLFLAGLLFYIQSSAFTWASCLGAGSLLFSAALFIKKANAQRIRLLELEMGSLVSRMEHVKSRLEGLSRILEKIHGKRKELSRLTGISEESLSGDFANTLKELEMAVKILDRRQMLLDEIQSVSQDLEPVVESIGLSLEQIKAAKAEMAENEAAWKAFISENHLLPGLKPWDMPLAARKISRLQEIMKQIKSLEAESYSLRQEIEDLAVFFSETGFQSLDMPWKEQPSLLLEAAKDISIQVSGLDKELKSLEDLKRHRRHRRQEVKVLEEEIEGIRSELSDLEQRSTKAAGEWKNWLKDKGLETYLEPDEFIQTADLLEEARKKLAQKDFLFKELEDTEDEMEAISHTVSSLFNLVFTGRTEPADISSQVSILTEKLSEELELEIKHRLLGQKAKGLEKEEQRLFHEIKALEGKISALLKEAGCSSSGEFRKLFRIFQQREELVHKKVLLSARLKAVAGSDDYEAISKFYGDKRYDGLARDVEDLSLNLEQIEMEIDQLVNRRAEINRELEELTSSEEHMNLMAQRSSLVQEAKELSRKWAVRTLALYILQTAKERFERENQPEVIRAASRYFSAITAGRYTGIVAAAGTNDIWAVTREGERVEPEKLSAGTAEQLYLSLRFGMMSACDTGGETLPVLMDDILVNFDPERTRKTALAIGELARERQLLFFTCHPHIAETLRQENPGAFLLHMDAPG